MKIAYIYDAVYPYETGGVQTRLWELSRRLADEHDVHWYGWQYWEGDKIRKEDGVTYHGVGEPQELYVDGRRSISEALTFSGKLLRPLSQEEFDIVDCQAFPHFSSFPSKIGSVLDGSTLFITWHEIWGDYWYEYLGWKGVFGKIIERSITTLGDEHISVSLQTQSALRKIGVKHSYYVPNGVNFDSIRSVPPVSEDIDVLFLGRFIKEKNVDLLVRAVSILQKEAQNIQCVLIGDGPDRKRIEQLVTNLDLNDQISILDFLETHEQVIRFMKGADVFVLPSRREGFGITALEAMACGTPVVTIHHPQNAVSDLINEGMTGYVTDPTSEALASAIPLARKEISPDACAQAAKMYEWDIIAEKINNVYHNSICDENM